MNGEIKSSTFIMYNDITRQSLPNEEYLRLLGIAICVFASNNSFIIENILNTNNLHDWRELIYKESERLDCILEKTITCACGG